MSLVVILLDHCMVTDYDALHVLIRIKPLQVLSFLSRLVNHDEIEYPIRDIIN